MHGERRRVDVGQPPDLIPGVIAVLVLQVPGEVLENQTVHRVAEKLPSTLWISFSLIEDVLFFALLFHPVVSCLANKVILMKLGQNGNEKVT